MVTVSLHAEMVFLSKCLCERREEAELRLAPCSTLRRSA